MGKNNVSVFLAKEFILYQGSSRIRSNRLRCSYERGVLKFIIKSFKTSAMDKNLCNIL